MQGSWPALCCAAVFARCVGGPAGNQHAPVASLRHSIRKQFGVSSVGAAAGETFHQAACRGLLEELGISAVVPDVPLGPMHRRSLVVPGLYIDNELVQSYRVDGFDGQVGWANLWLLQ